MLVVVVAAAADDDVAVVLLAMTGFNTGLFRFPSRTIDG